MSQSKSSKMSVMGSAIAVIDYGDDKYISLTDMAKKFGEDNIVYNWMRNRNTVEFLGIWEQIHNPGFKGLEFETFKKEAGLNSFSLTPRKWIEATGAIGIKSRAGRHNSGTFAHPDIAFEFGSWLSPEFKLYLLKEFQRLKADENRRLSSGWDLNRTLAKLNYRIHTDAIKEYIIPAAVTSAQAQHVYADEADMLNIALFGVTAKDWHQANPNLEGNIRDNASISQLLVLTNLENINAELIRMGMLQPDRLRRLNEIAISQLRSLSANSITKLQRRQ